MRSEAVTEQENEVSEPGGCVKPTVYCFLTISGMLPQMKLCPTEISEVYLGLELRVDSLKTRSFPKVASTRFVGTLVFSALIVAPYSSQLLNNSNISS